MVLPHQPLQPIPRSLLSTDPVSHQAMHDVPISLKNQTSHHSPRLFSRALRHLPRLHTLFDRIARLNLSDEKRDLCKSNRMKVLPEYFLGKEIVFPQSLRPRKEDVERDSSIGSLRGRKC